MNRTRVTRRELLKNSFSLAVAGSVLGSVSPKARATGTGEITGGFRIGACDWTLGKRSDPSSLKMARRIGLDGVQVDVGNPGNGFPLHRPETRKRFLEESAKNEVALASLAMGVLNDIPLKSDPRTEEWVRLTIDAATELGVKVILLAFFGKGDLREDPEGVTAVVHRLTQLAPKAEDAGIILGIESWLSAGQHLEILDRVGSEAVRVYYDVGNSNEEGHDIYQEIRTLGKRICEFHAKDYQDLYGKGAIDFRRVREAMDDIGYRGWIHMEGIRMPLGIEESCRYDLEYLRTVFPPQT